MIKAFVAIGLGAVVVFAPLAAMAQSAHAGGGGSHSRHMRYSRNAHKERARWAPNICATCATHPPLTRADQLRRAAVGARPTGRAALTTRGRGYFTGQGFTPQIS
jgi:hypothetical protein